MNVIDDLSAGIQTFRCGNTGSHQGTHRSCKLGTGSFDCQFAEQWDFHLDIVDFQPSLIYVIDKAVCSDHCRYHSKDDVPVAGRPFTEVHNPHRQRRHLNIQICKHINEDRDNIKQHNCNYTDDSTDQDDRIDCSFVDRSLQLGFFFKMRCHSVKRHLQTSGGFTCPYHIDQHRWEYIRDCCHGISQCITFFYIEKHIGCRLLEPFIFCLLRHHLQGFLHRNTCLCDADKLPTENAQISGLDFLTNRKIQVLIQNSLLFNFNRKESVFF